MLSEKKSQTSRPDPRHATFIKDSLDLSHESSSFQKSPSDDDPSSLSHIVSQSQFIMQKSNPKWLLEVGVDIDLETEHHRETD